MPMIPVRFTALFFSAFFILFFTARGQQQLVPDDCSPKGKPYCSASYQHQHLSRKSSASLEHLELMNQYDVTFYHLDISLERTSTYISGNVKIKANVQTSQMEQFAFELHPDLLIDSAKINNQLLTVSRNGGEASISLPAPLPNTEMFEVVIYYKGTPPSGASAAIGNGLSNGIASDWNKQVTWSLSEPYSAYEWWPCKQVLTDKADSVYVFVTTSLENKVGSNGLLTAPIPLPDNKIRYEWKSRYPIDYYLISVAVSDYQEYSFYAKPEGLSDSILVQNYLYSHPDLLPTFQNDINETAPLLVLYSGLYGLYPFWKEKYGHSMAPMGGGMEHQTMTTQSTFVFGLTAHELAHQWFGDQVTCNSWSHIWLNEGFATYSEYLALENLRDETEKQDWLSRRHNSVMTASGGSVYVEDTANVARIFNGRLTYNKGGAIVHTIRYLLNDDLFFTALRTYLDRYAYSTASAEDFKAVLEEVSGKDFTDFFNEWYYGEGYPVYNVSWNQKDGTFYLRNTQTTSSEATPFFSTPVQFRIQREGGTDTIVSFTPSQQSETYGFALAGEVSAVTVDPANWIINMDNVVRDTSLVSLVSAVAGQLQGLKVYPNPGRESLHFENISGDSALAEFFDLTGRLVRREEIDEAAVLDIRALRAGFYILKVSEGRDVKLFKFVKE
jgi:aminopeptidase N